MEYPTSIGVIAHFSATLGIGEAARRLLRLLEAAGVYYFQFDFDKNKSPKSPAIASETIASSTRDFISCVNPDQVASVIAEYPALNRTGVYHRGFWSWELEEFPVEFARTASLIDEIWSVSSFSAKAISEKIGKPVYVPRLPVPRQSQSRLGRNFFGFESGSFIVMTSFDYFSDLSRKNPEAAIEAFKLAFPRPVDNAIMIVKSINSGFFPQQHNHLIESAGGRKDIQFISTNLHSQINQSLISVSDIFLSLHRAEGYGINLIDAMSMGVTTVATGYSGNLDFMSEENSVLVPYTSKPVRFYAGLPMRGDWADPDVEWAASKIRQLYLDRNLCRKIGRDARDYVEKQHSLVPAVIKFKEEFIGR